MRFHVLATDYDGTLAHHGAVDDATISSVDGLRRSGRRAILVTGRQVEDLKRVCPELEIFDRVVAENGAVLYRPASKETRVLAEAPPAEFVQALIRRGVDPMSVGDVIVATWEPHEKAVLEVIHETGLELQVVFNKGAVMVLPSGVNKAFGLKIALSELGYSPHNTVAVGDAENDHALLSACEVGVAVANALPTLKKRADWTTSEAHGGGVRQLVTALVDSDLRDVGHGAILRHALVVGEGADGAPFVLPAYGPPLMVAGTSGGGKSSLATGLIEQLSERDYQYCIVDPEGDYRGLDDAIIVGDGHPPSIHEVMEVLASPQKSVVVNLLSLALGDRPGFFEGLFPRLSELRARTGRPHWILVDEAHHMLPEAWEPASLTLPRETYNLILITVHPNHVARAMLETVGGLIIVGHHPDETLSAFVAAVGIEPPTAPATELNPGEALGWLPRGGGAATRFKVRPPRSELRRHLRKYAFGELGADKSFYFRGPENRLNLRAQNLQIFVQFAEGLDDETWLFHLKRGDYSAWLREAIKDPALASEVAWVERYLRRDAQQSRARIKAAIERRYTGPA
jgi:hypothetical protein